MNKTLLRKYANLIAKTGVNVQPGQEVMIVCDLDQPQFVQMVAEECYKLGAKKVSIDWGYQPMAKVNMQYMTVQDAAKMEKWQREKLKHRVEVLPCYIWLDSDDPDGLKGIDPAKMAEVNQKRMRIVRKYREKMENKYQWCIAAVPGKAWAKKVFPDLRVNQAVEKLWQAILTASRVTDDPNKAWAEHNSDLEKRCAYLNSLGIDELVYKSSNGTDFRVGLMNESVFAGGGETSLKGNFFNPNIPSEECFTSPKRGRAEGVLHASLPLSYQGNLIEDFWIRFKDGKAVEWDAAKGKEFLTKMIGMDEGSAYLGECALVPYDSPIRNSGVLFYNTLFDENAACHFALGRGFMDCVRDFQNRTLEECYALGVNKSMIHVDFMVGCKDMDIQAKCRDGRTVQVFKDGNWAF